MAKMYFKGEQMSQSLGKASFMIGPEWGLLRGIAAVALYLNRFWRTFGATLQRRFLQFHGPLCGPVVCLLGQVPMRQTERLLMWGLLPGQTCPDHFGQTA